MKAVFWFEILKEAQLSVTIKLIQWINDICGRPLLFQNSGGNFCYDEFSINRLKSIAVNGINYVGQREKYNVSCFENISGVFSFASIFILHRNTSIFDVLLLVDFCPPGVCKYRIYFWRHKRLLTESQVTETLQ